MKNGEVQNNDDILRLLPSIDTLLRSKTALEIIDAAGAKHAAKLARSATNSLRTDIQESNSIDQSNEHTRESLFDEAEKRLRIEASKERNKSLKRVINATGVIIHTNLGRAPLSERAKRAMIEEASGYCSLEYNIANGKRGKRGARVEELLAELTCAESALIVNNCAAAAVLVLTALSKGGEAVISRGELVEIGGDFRIPDVMNQSGTGLIEVGSTNRTRLSDYEEAFSDKTRLILKVHPSNYRIIGFTSVPSVSELAHLAHRKGMLLYEDAGSGAIRDLSEYGLTDEPIISQSIAAGADVVTFSGDKLLGGTQAGLIVGSLSVIDLIRKHPLYRALRVSKLIYAALEATLEEFRKETVFEEIPVLRMLAIGYDDLKQRTGDFADKLEQKLGESSKLRIQVIKGKSVIGGGSAPAVQPKTILLELKHERMSANELEGRFRFADPPVITRILEDGVVIDLRTVSGDEENELLEIMGGIEY